MITSKTCTSLWGNTRGFAEDSVMEGPVSWPNTDFIFEYLAFFDQCNLKLERADGCFRATNLWWIINIAYVSCSKIILQNIFQNLHYSSIKDLFLYYDALFLRYHGRDQDYIGLSEFKWQVILSEILDFFFWEFDYISGFGYEKKVASGATSLFGLVSSKDLAKTLTKCSHYLKKYYRKLCENWLLADTTKLLDYFSTKIAK